MTIPTPPPEPYTPFAIPSPLRATYKSLVGVYRVRMQLTQGVPQLTWSQITDMIDPLVGVPGQMMCRIVLGFVRRGVDQPMPIVAGRAPDRVGVLYCDLSPGPTGGSYLKAGDRLLALAGPMFGSFEIRTVPDVAMDYFSPHHIECQVVEVAEALGITSPTPFPGSEGPDT